MDTERRNLEVRLEQLWEETRQGDPKALDELLRFIIHDARRQLRRYIPRADNPHAGRPTEILQRTAVKIHEKALQGTLEKPKETAFKTLGRYLVLTGKEVLHFFKITGGTLAPAHRFGVRQEHKIAVDPSGPSPLRLLSSCEEEERKKVRLREEVERLPDLDRRVLQGFLAGEPDPRIAAQLGLSPEGVRQRRHRALLHLRAILAEEFAA